MSVATTAKDPSTVLPADAAHLLPSQFHADIRVEVSKSLFGKPKFAWRECHIEGQRLQITDNTTVVATMATPKCVLKEHKPQHNTYQLNDGSKTSFVLHLPSATARAKLEQVLRLSSQSPHWVLPATNHLSDLVAVASSIVESEAVLKRPSGPPSGVTVDKVQAYLGRLKAFYDEFKDASPEHVYAKLLELEAAYVKDTATVDNLATVAHKLHPLEYAEFLGKYGYGMTPVQFGRIRPLRQYFRRCPHPSCAHPWTLTESFQIHIENQSLVCPKCHSVVNYDMYKVATLAADIPAFNFSGDSWKGTNVSLSVKNPDTPKDGQLKTFITDLSNAVKEQQSSTHRAAIMNQLQAGIRKKLEMYIGREVGRFHVDLVRGMYRLWLLIREIGPQYEYWSQPTVLQASIVRYQKYMKLVQVTPSKFREVATADIELVMQAHQQDHEAFFKYWAKATNDSMFTYSDDTENWDFEPSYAEMFIRWAEAYDEPFSSYPPSFEAWTATRASNALNTSLLKKKWAKYVRLPLPDSRFVGVTSSHVAVPTATLVTSVGDVKDLPSEAAAVRSGYVLGSPVPTVIPPQQSKQLDQLLEEDGFLCSERFVVNA